MFVCDLVDYNNLFHGTDFSWENGFAKISHSHDNQESNLKSVYMEEVISEESGLGYPIHINGCFWDNRRSNIDYSRDKETLEYKKAYGGNQNKRSGIEYMDFFGGWTASVIKNHKLILLGVFDNIMEAISAWCLAEQFRQDEYRRLLGDGFNQNKHINGKKTDFHSRFYINIDSLFFGLPEWFDSEQRCKLVKEITDHALESFEYHLPENNRDKSSEKITKRLDVLSSYIIDSVYKHKSGDVITQYKNTQINENEVPLGCDIDEIHGNNRKI